ncbi:MAG: 2-hydroxyacid dehydrogenase [bacterium]|nr:2-hydroxyacid dehydrogenase [bacterium]
MLKLEKYKNSSYTFKIKYFNVHLNKDTAWIVKDYEVVCAFVNDTIDRDTINILKTNAVKFLAMRCAGYNNVDLDAAYEAFNIARVPDYSAHAVAEHAIALMMALNRKIYKAYNRTRDTNFSLDTLLGFDMYGKTAGVIGMGKIGKCLVNILNGFGMNVLVYDKFKDYDFVKNHDIQYVELNELYSRSDIISLYCPLTPESKYIINKASIKLMKTGVMIINTSRGELINTKDLIRALKRKKVGFAGLDVYEEESEYFFEDFSNSMVNDDVLARLLTFLNVLITSHQAFFTEEVLHNIAEITLNNIIDFYEDKFLQNEICYQCEEKDRICPKDRGERCF